MYYVFETHTFHKDLSWVRLGHKRATILRVNLKVFYNSTIS